MKVPELEIKLNGVTYENSYEKDVTPDRTNLDYEFERQTSLYAFYSKLAAEAKYIENRKKTARDEVYAGIDHEVRTNHAALLAGNSKASKLTEKMVENSVITDSRYKDAVQAYHEAQRTAQVLDSAAKAMVMRKDMLIQMGAASRVGAPPAINAAQEQQVKEMIARNRKQGE